MAAPEVAPGEGPEGVGLYVFCFARAGAAQAAVGPGLTGDTPLGARVYGEVAAILCEVSLREWTGEAGEAHLKDLGWLGPRALRHEAVIERMMHASPVLPLRFGCLFSSAERLEDLLRREHARITAFLDRVAQEEEWSLQGRLDLAVCEEALFAADPRRARLPASAGARYLMDQKLRKDAAASHAGSTEDDERSGRRHVSVCRSRRPGRDWRAGVHRRRGRRGVWGHRRGGHRGGEPGEPAAPPA